MLSITSGLVGVCFIIWREWGVEGVNIIFATLVLVIMFFFTLRVSCCMAACLIFSFCGVLDDMMVH